MEQADRRDMSDCLYFNNPLSNEIMDQEKVVRALAALANPHRLALFRRLVAAGSDGVTAGGLAEEVGLAPTGLSFHTKELERAGLVSQVREGRFIRYRFEADAMRELIEFLTEDCCGGRPELCGIAAPQATESRCCEPIPAVASARPDKRSRRGA